MLQASPEQEPEELSRFRAEWLAEVQKHDAPPTQPVPSASAHNALASALDVYRRAVQHEQRGELDDALRSYRQAFSLVLTFPSFSYAPISSLAGSPSRPRV